MEGQPGEVSPPVEGTESGGGYEESEAVSDRGADPVHSHPDLVGAESDDAGGVAETGSDGDGHPGSTGNTEPEHEGHNRVDAVFESKTRTTTKRPAKPTAPKTVTQTNKPATPEGYEVFGSATGKWYVRQYIYDYDAQGNKKKVKQNGKWKYIRTKPYFGRIDASGRITPSAGRSGSAS